jgi:PAS domain S-box-containing protein
MNSPKRIIKKSKILNIDRNMAVSFSTLFLILLLGVLAIGHIFYTNFSEKNEKELESIIAGILNETINQVSFSGKFHARLLIEEISKKEPRLEFIVVSDLNHQIIAHSNPERNGKDLSLRLKRIAEKIFLGAAPQFWKSEYQNKLISFVALPFRSGFQNKIQGIICFGVSADTQLKEKSLFYQQIAGIIFVMFLFSLGATYFISKEFGRQVREMAMQLDGILAHAPFHVCINDSEGNIKNASISFLKKLEGKSEFLGKERIEIFSGKDVSEKSDIDRIVECDGETFLVSSFPIKKEVAGAPLVSCTLAQDLTKLYEAEKALRENEQNLRITLDSIGDAVLTTDSDGLVTRMNPVAERLTGWSSTEAIGLSHENVFRIIDGNSNKPRQSPAFIAMENGMIEAIDVKTILIQKSGDEISISDSAAPIRNLDGEIVGSVLVFRDVTEQLKMEEQLRQSQKVESIGRLAGGIAHDFNNMLAGIIGAADILPLTQDLNKEAQNIVKIIMTSAQKAADLTSKLLSYSRKSKTILTTMNFHQILNESLGILDRILERQLELKSELTATEVYIDGDVSQIQNSIINLVLNARDAMPEGGEVELKTRNVYLDERYCEGSLFPIIPGNYLNLSITDTGIGIPTDHISRIFDPFFTTKEVGKGTGLGLSAVYGMVRDHRGAITVSSQVDEGTVFDLYFPLKELNEADKTLFETIPEEIENLSGTILVVDDEDVVRDTLEKLIASLGCKVLTARDGKECVEVFTENANDIDLVILDVVMPEMDGQEAFYKIREIRPRVKVLMSSGFTRDAELETLLKSGLHGFIQKPYKRLDLYLRIKGILHNKNAMPRGD